MASLLVLAFLGMGCALFLAVVAGVLYLTLRCRSCGRLPVASRAESGWPDFSVGVCPFCGAARS